MNKQLVILLGIAFFLGGCSLTPKHTHPKALIPVEWPQGVAYEETAGITLQFVRGRQA